jgi:hypothetical protein
VGGSYISDLLPGYILSGIGMGFAFVPLSIVALSGVEERDYGLASGLINTTQNVGGAIGLAVASTLFATRLANEAAKLLAGGKPPSEAIPAATVSGMQLAFWVLAIIAFTGLAATLLALRGVTVDVDAEPQATAATACGFAPNRAATAHVATVLLGSEAVPSRGAAPG